MGEYLSINVEIISIFFQLLNSPWDVCFEPINEKVYIAMAGQHQIWEHNTLDGLLEYLVAMVMKETWMDQGIGNNRIHFFPY